MHTHQPYNISSTILALTNDIAKQLGFITGAKLLPPPRKLVSTNHIKSIQASFAMEGNSLSLQQVTALWHGKPVRGKADDIIKVNNAIKVNKNLRRWQATSAISLKQAHKLLMHGVINHGNNWRNADVEILAGNKVIYIPPSFRKLPTLMRSLFNFVKDNRQLPWLIKACVFHYELLYIHPFMDGNGRIARIWQQVLLMQEHPVFEYISIEKIIKSHQTEYYTVLDKCDNSGTSTLFIEFSLQQILTALHEFIMHT